MLKEGGWVGGVGVLVEIETLDFSKFELSIKFRETPHPPTLNIGILDFTKSELNIKFREPPPTLPQHRNFGFYQIWTQHQIPRTPPPTHPPSTYTWMEFGAAT